ncbi:MAG TPA: glycosyltransferase family 2 protein [Balneolaceae bacterium]|nr:glycosyltransferase family 2 protein [Balneolaceae bacterium]
MNKEQVSIIMPVYNEEKTIGEVLEKLLNLPLDKQIIVVDDASVDKSYDIATGFGDDRIKVIRKEVNEGKTAAIKTALQHTTGEIVVIQDADLEYDPDEIEHLCKPIIEQKADVVYGSRFRIRKESRVLYFYHYLGNRFLTFVSNVFTNKNMTDIETCYKAFRHYLIETMPITSSGFGFEVEVTANISKTKARIFETPISYYGRTYEEGKKITFMDGISALLYIFRFNLFSTSAVKNYIQTVNEKLSREG